MSEMFYKKKETSYIQTDIIESMYYNQTSVIRMNSQMTRNV